MSRGGIASTVGTVGTLLALGAAAIAGQTPSTYRLSLGDAARLAAERSTPVLEARARSEAAEARVQAATSELLPHAEADLAWGARSFNTASFGLDFPTLPGQDPFFDPNGEVVGPVRSADVRARLEVPLLDFAALGRRKSAQAGVDAVREGEAVAEEQAARTAAVAYLSALRARAEVRAREQDLELAEELRDVAQGILDAGVGVAIDVTRAESQVATIRAQLLSARHRADASDLALRHALRIPGAATLALTDALDSRPVGSPPTEADAIARALDARSDLAMAEAYRTAAGEALSATRARRLPRLSAAVDDGLFGNGFDHMLNTYTWSLMVRLPVFDGFGTSARAQEQQAELSELGYRIEDLREGVVFQVREALLNLSAAQEQAGAAEERRRLAQLEVDQEAERVRAGVAGTADVVRAAQRLNEARTALLDALWASHNARLALAAAMGSVRELP